jgi:hypothetical protein
MSDREVRRERLRRDALADTEVPEDLAWAVERWREAVPPRDAWRESVLRAVDDERRAPVPRTPADVRAPGVAPRRRRWTISPLLGLAAAIVCLVGGAALGALLQRRAATVASRVELIPISATPADRDALATSLTRFAIVAPSARRVTLVGDFNRWDPARMPMRPLGDGRTWVLDVPLHPGRHVYAYVVDGDVIADPSAPRAPDDDFGVPSSVVLVMGPG